MSAEICLYCRSCYAVWNQGASIDEICPFCGSIEFQEIRCSDDDNTSYDVEPTDWNQEWFTGWDDEMYMPTDDDGKRDQS